ncbi:hypothetical protein [Bradyrhizobium sp. USDA 4486]
MIAAVQLICALRSMRVSSPEHSAVCCREGGDQECRLDGEREDKPIETNELAVANSWRGAPSKTVLSSSPGVT